jgi:predicted phosphodiesterase
MRTLIVGDVHNEIDLINIILKNNDYKYDEIVFLGDYFDSYFGNVEHAERTAYWLKEKLSNSKYVFIWGNHDVHYRFFRNKYIQGSGYSRNKADAINKIMKTEDWNKLKFFYYSQNFLFSHAGINENMLHPLNGFDLTYLDKICRENYCNNLVSGEHSAIFSPGIGRGGFLKKGGITWQDWDVEFIPIRNLNQIVGHSHSDNLRYKCYNNSININVDCLPNYLLEIDNGKLKEIKL